MCIVYKCRLDDKSAYFEGHCAEANNTISRRDFERMLSRRQLGKISTATQIACVMFQYFSINDKLREVGCDPTNVPIVICNRYANWDYVAEVMSPSIEETMRGVNSYVATAWFPATVQGHLTIANRNIGEAITISTKDKDMICATIDALMPRGNQSTGAVIMGTFESVPGQIAGRNITGQRLSSFGALSMIRSNDSANNIGLAVHAHQGMYGNDTK